MPITTINISLPDTLKTQIEAIITNEGYGNVSEFFRVLIRDHIREQKRKKFEELVLEGLNSGPGTPLTHQDFIDIEKRAMKRLRDLRKHGNSYKGDPGITGY